MVTRRTSRPDEPVSLMTKAARVVASPFTEAENLASYSDWGYALLGAFPLSATVYLWVSGVLSGTLVSGSPLAQAFFGFIAERLHLTPNTSVVPIPILLWVAGFSYPPTRRWVGERWANFVFWALEQMIAAGEWCMEHRWPSLVLIIVLVAVVAAGISHEVTVRAQIHDLQRDFESWFSAAEQLLMESSMTQPEGGPFPRRGVALAQGFRFAVSADPPCKLPS